MRTELDIRRDTATRLMCNVDEFIRFINTGSNRQDVARLVKIFSSHFKFPPNKVLDIDIPKILDENDDVVGEAVTSSLSGQSVLATVLIDPLKVSLMSARIHSAYLFDKINTAVQTHLLSQNTLCDNRDLWEIDAQVNKYIINLSTGEEIPFEHTDEILETLDDHWYIFASCDNNLVLTEVIKALEVLHEYTFEGKNLLEALCIAFIGKSVYDANARKLYSRMLATLMMKVLNSNFDMSCATISANHLEDIIDTQVSEIVGVL